MSWNGIQDYKDSIGDSLKMPYGKHKGVHPADLPIKYCLWLREQGIDKKIGETFSKVIGSKIWNYKQDLKKLI